MGEKRKRSSTILVRPQTASKRRSTTPVSQPTPPPLKPEVPTSFAKDGPLPVLAERQPDDLPLKEYKSVAESKVLMESLARSAKNWIDGNIFDKFWIKPLKARKLDPALLEGNPGRDCMVKLGNATMSSLPHKFDIRLYQVLRPVKEQPLPPPPPPVQQRPYPPVMMQQPVQRPIQHLPVQPTQPHFATSAAIPNTQSSNPTSVSGPSLPQVPLQHAQTPVASQQPQQQQPKPATQATSTQTSSAIPQQIPQIHGTPAPSRPHPPPNQTVHTPLPAPRVVPNVPPPARQQQPHPPPRQPPQQHIQPPQQGQPVAPLQPPRPDPVIQMLAMKAATDTQLKELMRIVASGKATREQLQEFQGYIDTLTAASNNPILGPPGHQPRQGPPPQQMPQQPQHVRHQLPPTQPLHQQPMQPHTQMQHQHHQMYPHPHQQHQQPVRQYPPQQPAQHRPAPQPKARAFPQAPKQEIVGIVFEYLDNISTGDRYLFPKYTILEYLNRGTTVKASFIITRKLAGEEQAVYQPVTITLECPYPRILEHLKMVVADPDTTRNHMKHIMENMRRVSETYLVYRLRREPGEAIPNKTYIESRMNPPPRSREPRHGRDMGTPMRETKSGGNSTQPRSYGPKVKHVKKHIPKSTSTRFGSPTAADDSPSAIRADSSSPPQASGFPKLPKPPRSRKGRIADPTKSCHICQTSKTSLWRKADIEGENVTVCNACGIKWKTNAQKQAQIAAAVANGLPIPTFGDERRSSSAGGGQRPTLESLQHRGGPQMMLVNVNPAFDGVDRVTEQVFSTVHPSSPALPLQTVEHSNLPTLPQRSSQPPHAPVQVQQIPHHQLQPPAVSTVPNAVTSPPPAGSVSGARAAAIDTA